MIPTTCVVIPSYWTRAGGESRPQDAVYDHPTPLDGTSTLPALLNSLEKLDTSTFYVLILAAVTGEDVYEATEHLVREMVAGYPSLISLVFGPTELAWLHRRCLERGIDTATSYLNLRGYPTIRNLQLAVPHALHSSAIVALDDDEIVVDEAFMTKATENLGQVIDGIRVDGLSGHYLQEDGTIHLAIDPEKAKSENLFERKAVIMNQGADVLEKLPGQLVETPFCFGGNMEFTPELIAAVGFDPGITRGEDIDYLINARLEGKHFFLRKDLSILHCPPHGGSYKDANIAKLQQDVIRFLYEREKLKASAEVAGLIPLTADDLKPYPGDFLGTDIEEHCVTALQRAGFGEAQAFVNEVLSGVSQRVSGYLDFRLRWPALMQALYDDHSVSDYLTRKVQGL